MIYQIDNKRPTFHQDTFVAPNATLIGDVQIHQHASIWFNVVIRADNDTITIGEGSNIQDGSILHVDAGKPILVGKNVTIGHKVMLHGCTIGDGSLVGMNAVILNGATIGKGCLIGANSLIPENVNIPDGSMVLGSPGKVVKQLTDEHQALLAKGANHYVENGKKYRASGKVITD
ncbi:gamma carbonic anhydrase family protein [Thalassomonas sp. M1454]|uniref:gamma carbonic anhydrase family protein n=1 Tax=Thalassomonas sp. M1454 TaxID=2594477 RepID=UPI001180A16E|nr:gamma carbonic anhydrase family protein [Thalassomonas sp. M1454]TRX57120.1 gamma carbonic anhydrase family protein [Thalassomonas sp. M1454]